jgi:hypothetical protein
LRALIHRQASEDVAEEVSNGAFTRLLNGGPGLAGAWLVHLASVSFQEIFVAGGRLDFCPVKVGKKRN